MHSRYIVNLARQTSHKHWPRSAFGVSSHLFFLALAWCPGVPSRPGVAAPGVAWPGVASHCREEGVAPGVSLPFGRPGVSSQRLFEGVGAVDSAASHDDFFLAADAPVSAAWSQRRRFPACFWASDADDPFTECSSPALAFSCICWRSPACRRIITLSIPLQPETLLLQQLIFHSGGYLAVRLSVCMDYSCPLGPRHSFHTEHLTACLIINQWIINAKDFTILFWLSSPFIAFNKWQMEGLFDIKMMQNLMDFIF